MIGRGVSRAALVAFFAAIALALGASTAFGFTLERTDSPLPGSNFQGGDGNQEDAATHIDWQALQQLGLVHTKTDLGPGTNLDDHFTAGSSEGSPGSWQVTTSGNLGDASADILNVYHTFTRAPNGDAFLYLAATRADNTGTSWSTFELNQKEPRPNGLPCRSTGDLLISLQQLGTSSDTTTVLVQRWQTTGALDVHGCAQTGTLVDVAARRLSNQDIQGANNPGTITRFLPGVTNGIVASNTIGARGFVEAALNLTQILGLGGEEQICDAGTFLSFWAHSRASDSLTAALKDFVAPIGIMANPCPAKTVTITKVIQGDAAQDRSDIEIHLQCTLPDGSHTDVQTFPISTEIDEDTVTESFEVPHNVTSCRVTEPVDGSNSRVSVVTTFSVNGGAEHSHPVSATFGPGVLEAHFTVTDTYTHAPGKLIVDKVITGDAADHRDAITVHASCTGTPARSDSWTIPAGQTPDQAGFPHTITDIPAHAECTVSEDPDGSNSAAQVVTTFDPSRTVEIPPGGEATVTVTNDFTHNPGKLIVDKSIIGGAADHRDAITVHASCTGDPARSGSWTIEAGQTPSEAGFPHTITDVPAHAMCTVSEHPDGSNSAADVVATFDPSRTVEIPPGGEATVHVTDDFTHNPGKLVVNKSIIGAAADHRGPITINASSTGDPARSGSWTIPAGHTPAQAGFPHTITGIPAHAECTVSEHPDGSNSAADVVATFDPSRTVEIPPGGEATVHVTDDFTHNPGKLIVDKSINGAAASHRDAITVHASCTGDPSRSGSWTIPAGQTPAQAGFPHTITGIPAHAICTVSEHPDGSNSAAHVVATFDPSRSVEIPPGGEATVHVTDDFTLHPQEADLGITKTSSVSSAAPGDQVTYTLVVTNHGPNDASDVTVSDPLHAGLTLISTMPSEGSCSGTQTVHCSLGTLPVGGSVQILVVARLSSSFTGSLRNVAHVTSSTPDPDLTNNSDHNTIVVQRPRPRPPAPPKPPQPKPKPPAPPQPKADVGIVKTVDRATALTGERLTYTLKVTNHGSVTAPDVVATDTSALPLTIVSVQPSQGSCNRSAPVRCSLGTLAAGKSATVTIIAEARRAGDARNTATVTAAIDDSDPSNNISTAHTTIRQPKPPPPRVTG